MGGERSFSKKDDKNEKEMVNMAPEKDSVPMSSFQSKRKKSQEKAAKERQERRAYEKRKKIVHELEEDNYGKLIVFKSMGGDRYWKMIGHSAVIYSTSIADRLKREIQLWLDTDYSDKDEYGFVALNNIEKFEEELKRFKIWRVSSGLEKERILFFDLGYKVTKLDIKNLYRRGERLKEQLNKVLLPKNSHPGLYSRLREMLNQAYLLHRKTEEPMRGFTYDEVLAHVVRANRAYIELSRSRKKVEVMPVLVEIYREIEAAMAGLKMVSDIRLWDPKPIRNLQALGAEAEKLVIESHNRAKKKQEEVKSGK